MIDPSFATVWKTWSMPVAATTSIVICAAVYALGCVRIRHTRREMFPSWRAACFILGLVALWLAIASPLAEFDDYLLVAHMTQHLVLMSVTPPLLLLGFPIVPLLRGLPKSLLRRVFAQLFSVGILQSLGRFLTHPIVAWIAMNLSYVAWHVPAAYELALRSEGWHYVEHSCFFFTSLMFWFPVVRPWPSVSRTSRWPLLLYLLGADVINTALSAFLTFCGRVLYPSYADAPRISSLSPLSDQVAAGAFMWVAGSVAFLLPAVFIAAKLLSPAVKACPEPHAYAAGIR